MKVERCKENCRYATEGVNLACRWAYRGATVGAALGGKAQTHTFNILPTKSKIAVYYCMKRPLFCVCADAYYMSRLPIVERRLAQGGVRLAAILNGVFDPNAPAQVTDLPDLTDTDLVDVP